jgi:hypothetical protein
VSARDIALCVIAALTLASMAGTGLAVLMYLRKAPGGAVVLVFGPSAALGAWALAGWIWYFSGGTVS